MFWPRKGCFFVKNGHKNKNYFTTAVTSIFTWNLGNIWTGSVCRFCFGWVLWRINHCRLFNAKSSLYIYVNYIWFDLVWFYDISSIVGYWIFFMHIYIKYFWFGFVWFYGISTIAGYLMPNPLRACILNIYDLVWLDFIAYQLL